MKRERLLRAASTSHLADRRPSSTRCAAAINRIIPWRDPAEAPGGIMALARSLTCRQRQAYPTVATYARASSNFIPCEAYGERRQVSVGASPFRELTSGIPRGDRRNATLRASRISQERGITVENFASAWYLISHETLWYGQNYQILITFDNVVQKDKN